MACVTPGIPHLLHRDGREIIQDFSTDHRLFIRVPKGCFEGPDSDIVSLSAFKSSRQSTNRDAFSDPEDVLYNIDAAKEDDHFFDWGIVSIGIAELEAKVFVHPEQTYSFRSFPFHSPEECMYPHTEILQRRVDDDNEIDVNARTLKTKIRAHYRDLATIVKHPK